MPSRSSTIPAPRRSRGSDDAQNVSGGRRVRAQDRGDRKRAAGALALGGARHGYELDDREKFYDSCYPPLGGGLLSATAAEMIERRRERATLDALTELVNYLRDMREERKAIVTVTEGWLLFPAGLAAVGRETQPGGSNLGRSQRPAHDQEPECNRAVSRTECDSERLQARDDR